MKGGAIFGFVWFSGKSPSLKLVPPVTAIANATPVTVEVDDPHGVKSFEAELRQNGQTQVVDQDNKPVAGIRYSIKDADGKVSEGTLGSDGDIMMAGIKPGKVDVTFPDFDADAITE